MMVKVNQSVAFDEADHSEVKPYLDKCAAAAVVFDLRDCVIFEGDAETGSLPILGLVAVGYYWKIRIAELLVVAEAARKDWGFLIVEHS